MERPKAGQSGSSSDDLEFARSLSRRLRGGTSPAAAAEPGYASFSARLPSSPQPLAAPLPPPVAPVVPPVTHVAARVLPPRPSPRVAAATPRPTPAPPPPAHAAPAPRPSLPLMTRREALKAPDFGFGSDSWNKLLDGCARAALADAAFLMDPAGLIIGARGPKAAAELEGIGARLMVAFEQADLIDGARTTLSMSVEMPRGTLHGLRLTTPDGGFLTLGLIIPGGLTGERQARLLSLLTAAER